MLSRKQGDVLIATLGVEPQVVSLALDELREEHWIDLTVVLHTDSTVAPIAQSYKRLRGELPHYREATPPVKFRFAAICDEAGNALTDVLTEADAKATLRAIYREVLEVKRAGRRVHLCIAGGRKVMSAYGTAVAQLLFDENDRCWHLMSEGNLLRDKHMHAAKSEDCHLVPVPIIGWSAIPPIATDLAKTDDPWQAIEQQKQLRRQEEHNRRRDFTQRQLTPAENELLHLLAQSGGSNDDLAQGLHRSRKTVSNQLSAIFAKYHDFQNFSNHAKVDRGILIAHFAPLAAEKWIPANGRCR